MLAAGALLRVFGLMLTRRVSMVHAHLASGSSFWRKTAFVAIAARRRPCRRRMMRQPRRERRRHGHALRRALLRSRTPRSTIALWQKSSIFGIAWTALTVNEAKGGNVASLTASHPQFGGSRFRVRL
jgi:hypothetical protein